MTRTRWMLALAAATLCGGCGRATYTTRISADGSWVRRDTFVGQVEKAGSEPGFGAMFSVSLGDIFRLPGGAGWTVTRATKKDELTITAVRTVTAGETLVGDVGVKGGPKGKPAVQLTSTVTVRKIGPGRIEYREVLHWNGALPNEIKELKTASFLDPADLAAFRKAIPEEIVQAGKGEAMPFFIVRALVQMLFGPPEPMMMDLVMNPDFSAIKMQRSFILAMDAYMQDSSVGAKMTPEARKAALRKIARALVPLLKEISSKETKSPPGMPKMDGPTPGAGGQNEGGLPILTFAVEMPGRVVECNGELDEFTNSVAWSLFPVAAVLGDVTLRAVCEVGK